MVEVEGRHLKLYPEQAQSTSFVRLMTTFSVSSRHHRAGGWTRPQSGAVTVVLLCRPFLTAVTESMGGA